MNQKIKIIIDWCAFTVHGLRNPDDVIRKYLGMDPELFTACKGLNAYKDGMEYNNIRISYNGPEVENFGDMGISVSMSGTGCRAFEASTNFVTTDKHGLECSAFAVLFQLLHEHSDRLGEERVNVTRIDLACDDHNRVLDMVKICEAVDNNEIRSKIRARALNKSYNGQKLAGLTAYIGSKSSDFFIRFYDKRLERGQLDSTEHWVRCELVMKKDHATAFIPQFVNHEHIGTIVSCILNDKLAFIERDDSNISRCTICDWWLKFVDSIESVQLVSREAAPKSVAAGYDWLQWQCAPWMAIIKKTMGFEVFLRMLDDGEERLTPKHLAIIREYHSLEDAERT